MVSDCDGQVFDGVMIDSGAARSSTCGMTQYSVYCHSTGREVDIDSSKAPTCYFGIIRNRL